MARTHKADSPIDDTTAEVIHVLHGGHSFLDVPIGQLRTNPRNARRRFDPERMKELASSIVQHGILEPLVVRPVTDSDNGVRFEIVAGERRYRAAAACGLTAVPVIARPLSDEAVLEFSLIENLQRDDLTPMEQARGFQALIEANPAKHTPASIAVRIGVSDRWVWDRLKLLDLTKAAQQHLEHGRLPLAHAFRIARLKPADQARALDAAFTTEGPTLDGGDGKKPVTVRELDAWIAHHVRFDAAHAGAAAPLDFAPVAERVSQASDVVAITYDSYVPPDAKDGSRTFTPQTWKRADGLQGSKRCAAAVLGVVAVGKDYGTAFEVCTTKTCDVHWKRERLNRAKQADPKGQAAQERATRETEKMREQHEAAAAARTAWTKATPAITTAIGAAINKAPIARVIDLLLKHDQVARWIPAKTAPPRNADRAVRLLAFAACRAQIDRWDASEHFPRTAKLLGVNTAALLKGAKE